MLHWKENTCETEKIFSVKHKNALQFYNFFI